MSQQSLEPEALREALSSVSEHARPRPDCPPPADIWAAVQGELSSPDAQRVVEHVAGCLVCAEAWDLTRDLAAAGTIDSEMATAQRPGSEVANIEKAGSPWPVWLGLAATILLVLQLPVFEKTPSNPRGGGQEVILQLLPETVPRNDFRLHWSGPEATESYVLQLSWALGNDYQELPKIDIAATGQSMTYLVDGQRLADIPDGARLIGWLRAMKGGDLLDEQSFTVLLE